MSTPARSIFPRVSGTDPLAVRNINLGNGSANNATVKLSGDQAFTINDDSGTFTVSSSGGTKTIQNVARDNTIAKAMVLSADVTVQTDADALAVSGNISGSGRLLKTGAGTLVLSGSNTFNGATTVSVGTLLYNGTNTDSAVTVAGGAVLGGEGSIGSLTVSNGAAVAAGSAVSDVGTLTLTAMHLEVGGTNVVELADADGVKGTGWDLISAGSGELDLNSSSETPFVIVLDDIGATGFTNTNTYAWVIMEGGVITDFAANKFSVDTNSFSPPLGGGSFSVGTNEAHGLVLNYTPPYAGPLLEAFPDTMSFSARRGQDPAADDTFVVSNANGGTLYFTNAISYGAGATGWMTIGPETGAVGAAGSATVTGVVNSASLAKGTYYATNTVSTGGAGISNVVVSLSVTGYTGVVMAEPFSGDDGYAATEVLSRMSGGEGWGANAWTSNATSPEVYIETGTLDTFTDYCDNGALKARINMNEASSGDRFRECYRSFGAVTSGVVFVAFKMKMEKDNNGNVGGIKLMDGGSDRIWLGKIDAGTRALSIRYDGASFQAGSYEITAGNTFLIVARFVFGSQECMAKAYTPAQFTSINEPGSSGWEVSATVSTPITPLSRISLVAERPLVDGDERGFVMWDDVRMATRWDDLICGATNVQGIITVTNATFSALEVGDKVSDQVLNSGAFPVSVDLYDAHVPIFVGADGGGFFPPDFDLVNAGGGAIVQDVAFNDLIGADGGKVVTASNTTLSSITAENILVGDVTLQWSAIDS